MKKLNYLSWLMIAFFAISCTKDPTAHQPESQTVELTKDEIMSLVYNDSEELSEDEILKIVASFKDALHDNATRSAISSFNIGNKLYINTQGEFKDKGVATRALNGEYQLTSPVYEVEFTHGNQCGLAVISGNINMPTVIAFISDKGDERVMEASGANEMLHASKSTHLYQLIKQKELADSLRIPTLEKISQALNIPISDITYEKIEKNIIVKDGEQLTRVTAVPRSPEGVNVIGSQSVLQLVKTNWSQEAPYNGNFYLTEAQDSYGNWPLVGCVNVALGQMMTYTHRQTANLYIIPGTNIGVTPDWVSMSAKPTISEVSGAGNTHIKQMLHFLYKKNRTVTQKDWMGKYTSSDVSEANMLNTMSQYFLYSPKSRFDANRTLSALRAKQLVMMLTNDHAFFIDGVLVTDKAISTRSALVRIYDVYWHTNFGWGDACTGYYKLDNSATVYFEAGSVRKWCFELDYINNVRKR